MTVSQPSREIYAVDVPEVSGVAATFQYNFFVPDESVNESGGVPAIFLQKPAGEIDAAFIQYSTTRAPRAVNISWTKSLLAIDGTSTQARRDSALLDPKVHDDSILLQNVDRIVTEEQFASRNYVAVHFSDAALGSKLRFALSSSMLQHADVSANVSRDPVLAAATIARSAPTGAFDELLLSRAAAEPAESYGGRFYRDAGVGSNRAGTAGVVPDDRRVAIESDFLKRLRSVGINAQFSTRLLPGMLDRAIQDPASTNALDLVNLRSYAQQLDQATRQRTTMTLAENDYKAVVPYVGIDFVEGSAPQQEKYSARLVGYLIDKVELASDGRLVAHPPIVIDNVEATFTVDYRVRFNARYRYTVRAVVLFTVPAVDEASGTIALIKVLVSSRPSTPAIVSTLHLDSPPAPVDIKPIWNYATNKLSLTWTFPVSTQRAVKKFQVFSRKRTSDVFELRKVYDFDDSRVPFPERERPDARLVERVSSPITSWIDDDFDWQVATTPQRGIIYAICSIDAHGLTSPYSAQYRVWFNRFKNTLQVELISHSGAPKPYPNLYLNAELFVNAVRVSGNHAKRMRLYFNPDYYVVQDDNGTSTNVLETLQRGGSYRLQFINLDNGGTQVIDVGIDDRTLAQPGVAMADVLFGQKRR